MNLYLTLFPSIKGKSATREAVSYHFANWQQSAEIKLPYTKKIHQYMSSERKMVCSLPQSAQRYSTSGHNNIEDVEQLYSIILQSRLTLVSLQ